MILKWKYDQNGQLKFSIFELIRKEICPTCIKNITVAELGSAIDFLFDSITEGKH